MAKKSSKSKMKNKTSKKSKVKKKCSLDGGQAAIINKKRISKAKVEMKGFIPASKIKGEEITKNVRGIVYHVNETEYSKKLANSLSNTTPLIVAIGGCGKMEGEKEKGQKFFESVFKQLNWNSVELGAGATNSGVPGFCADVKKEQRDKIKLVGWVPAVGEGNIREEYQKVMVVNPTDKNMKPDDQWGIELPSYFKMLKEVRKRVPDKLIFFLMYNGGSITKRESETAIKEGYPLIVVEGSGRAADDLVKEMKTARYMKKYGAVYHAATPTEVNDILDSYWDLFNGNEIGLRAIGISENLNKKYQGRISKGEEREILRGKPKLTLDEQKELNGQLFKAISEQSLTEIEELLNEGADVNAKDEVGEPVLIKAFTQKGYLSQLPIGPARWDIPDSTFKGYHLLNIKIAKLLIEKGADVNARDRDGRTALRIAIDEGNKKIIELLRKTGAKR